MQRICTSQQHQALGMRERQRARYRGFNRLKQCGVRADAYGQRCDCQNGESGAGAQLADAVTKILFEIVHPADAALIPAFFFALRWVAEIAQGGFAGSAA